jgi:hypothetical protein
MRKSLLLCQCLAIVGAAVIIGRGATAEPEFQPLFINPYIQQEIFANCKKYTEAVYMDQLAGMHMMHPEAQNKEATAAEIAKQAFLDCYRPLKEAGL